MRLGAVSCLTQGFFLILLFIVTLPNSAYSQAKFKPKTVTVNQVFIVARGLNLIFCAKVENNWISGILLGNGVSFVSDNAKFEARLLKASAKGKSFSAKKISRLKKRIGKKNNVCISGPPRGFPEPEVTSTPYLPPATPIATPYVDPLRPLERSMTKEDVQHLFRRSALGYIPKNLLDMGLNQGVRRLVSELFIKRDDSLAEDEARKLLTFSSSDLKTTVLGVKLYALMRTILTKNPGYTQLCMIHLHDILSVSVDAVSESAPEMDLMVRYFDTLCGISEQSSYRDLIKEMTVEPAMLYWLSGRNNTKDKPNENYARELMELFTIGAQNSNKKPNYTDLDIATAARALTGLKVINDPQTGLQTSFDSSLHDSDPNKLMFRNTAYQGAISDWESLVDHLFDRHPNIAYNLAKMIAQRYVRPDIDKVSPAFVNALAQDLKNNNFNIVSTLKRLLISEEFYLTKNRHSILLSPVEGLAHVARVLISTGMPYQQGPFPLAPSALHALTLAGGMELAAPPSVFGIDREEEFTIGSRHLMLANWYTSLFGRLILNSENNELQWNYKKLYPPGVANPSAHEIILHLSDLFSLSLNAQQYDILIRYMNSQLTETIVNGQVVYTEVSDPWQPASYVQARRKISGVIRMFLGMQKFRVY